MIDAVYDTGLIYYTVFIQDVAVLLLSAMKVLRSFMDYSVCILYK